MPTRVLANRVQDFADMSAALTGFTAQTIAPTLDPMDLTQALSTEDGTPARRRRRSATEVRERSRGSRRNRSRTRCSAIAPPAPRLAHSIAR